MYLFWKCHLVDLNSRMALCLRQVVNKNAPIPVAVQTSFIQQVLSDWPFPPIWNKHENI